MGLVCCVAKAQNEIQGDAENVQKKIQDDVENNVQDKIQENQVENNVQDKIQGDVENNVQDEIQRDVENNAQDIQGDVENQVENNVQDDTEVDIEDGRDGGSGHYSKCWEHLPTELLVKILSYLPTSDMITMRYVSHRFREVSEIPLLWKEFIWPDYKPHHMSIVSDILKTKGEYVRQIFFPGHVSQTEILELLQCCTEVTHLSIPIFPKMTRLSEPIRILSMLDKVVCTLTHLQQLDLFTSYKRIIQCYNSRNWDYSCGFQSVIRKLEMLGTVSVKKLKFQIHSDDDDVIGELCRIFTYAKTYDLLPSVINIIIKNGELKDISGVLFFVWSKSRSYVLPSFEIGIYDGKQIPMNLHPPIPYCVVKFGPATTPFIRLSNLGLVGLQHDVFHLREYDHYGTVRHAITSTVFYRHRIYESLHEATYESLHEATLINYFSCLRSVSQIDICDFNLNSIHLEQLAIACPNLQRLNVRVKVTCLGDLNGLHAIVSICQKLEGLKLLFTLPIGSKPTLYLLLWELLSSIKRLTHLAIDMYCVMKPLRCNDADMQKLINMFKKCQHLQALELYCLPFCQYHNSNDYSSFLFSYFPFLTHCRMCNLQHSLLPEIHYSITYCLQLKYLYVEGTDKRAYSFGYVEEDINICEKLLVCKENVSENLPVVPSTSNFHLQQLYIHSRFCYLTYEFVNSLSAHGGLERVILYVGSIAPKGVFTLIKNSPKLVLLHVLLYPKGNSKCCCDCAHIIKSFEKELSDHKLYTVGYYNFKVHFDHDEKNPCSCILPCNSIIDIDLYSLW